jgi:hypothetical protein
MARWEQGKVDGIRNRATVPESQIQESPSVSRKRRTPANESAGSSDSSPDPSELDEEKRTLLRDVLRQADIKPTREIIERLITTIQPLMAEFRLAASQSTCRDWHDALRALLRLVDEKGPSVAVIRKRIAEIEAVDIAEAEGRAHRLWSRIFLASTWRAVSILSSGRGRRRKRCFWRRSQLSF